MRILIDMDGVLADFEAGFLRQWQQKHPDKPYVPLDKRDVFYITEQYPEEDHALIWEIFLAPDFMRTLPPIAGSLEALAQLDAMPNLDLFICTTPFSQFHNCVLEKYLWVEEHLGDKWTDRIILAHDKTVVTADIIIDDKPEITGVATPTWEHIIYDHPQNRMENCKRRLTWANWRDVLFQDL